MKPDVNDILADLRSYSAYLKRVRRGVTLVEDSMVYAFDVLDQWMSGGGLPPTDWQPNRTKGTEDEQVSRAD